MSEHLTETAAQVAAEIPRYSWVLMDEEQRDDLMQKVVLPRYMKQTADGVNLGPTWWSGALGTTKRTVEARVHRLRAKISDSDTAPRAEPNSRTGRAAATLRDPDKAAEILADPEVRQSVLKALDTDRDSQRQNERVSQSDNRTQPLALVGEFRVLHKTVERLARLVLSGRAVVSEDQRGALIDEVRWLRNALDHIESGLNAGSLDKALVALLEADR